MSTNAIPQMPSRLVRFQEAGTPPDGPVLWGEPVNSDLDIGKSLVTNPPQEVKMKIWARYDARKEGVTVAEEIVVLGRVLSPLGRGREAINVPHNLIDHNLLPEPFYKSPHPPKPHYRMPNLSVCPDAITFSPAIGDDEEMHLAIQLVLVGNKDARNIAPEDAMDHVLGYTVAVTARIKKIGDETDSGPAYDGAS